MALNLLQRTRLYKGYHQFQMAEMIGVSRKIYNLKENGKRDFTAVDITKISKYLDLTLDEVNEIFFDNLIPKRGEEKEN